jgi:hypothetical protein
MSKQDDPARYWQEWVRRMVAAWDGLPTGDYPPAVIDRWLNKEIGPVMKRARDALTAGQEDRVMGSLTEQQMDAREAAWASYKSVLENRDDRALAREAFNEAWFACLRFVALPTAGKREP